MHPVIEAFPRRRLRVRARGSIRAILLMIAGMLLFGGFLAMLAAEVLPDLRNDFLVRDSAQPTALVALKEGSCRSRLALVQDCTLTLSWRDKDGSHIRTLHYLFVEAHLGRWGVRPMADPARLELVTTDLGLERLTNRTLTLAGVGVITLLLVAGALRGMWNTLREARRLRGLNRQELVPVSALFEHGALGQWQVRGTDGASYRWPVRRKDRPFILDAANARVLALAPSAGGPAFPLDARLARVDLNADERRRILAAAPDASI